MKAILASTAVLAILATALFSVPVSARPDNKITICHVPPGNPENIQMITISENAWPDPHQHHCGLVENPINRDGPLVPICDYVLEPGDVCEAAPDIIE